MQFKPNYDLIQAWEDADRAFSDLYHAPYVAIFERDGKILVYMCDKHDANISFDMVDACFKKFGLGRPDVLLTEFSNSGREMTPRQFQVNTLAYAAGVAAKHDIPAVLADLSDKQMLEVLHRQYPTRKFTEKDLGRFLCGPMRSRGEDGEMGIAINMFGRDRFMLDNIAAALNKYNVVFAIFGSGHYEQQRLALIDMLGEPKYITKIPNMRGEFDSKNIKEEKLVDFKIGETVYDTNKTCQNSGR